MKAALVFLTLLFFYSQLSREYNANVLEYKRLLDKHSFYKRGKVSVEYLKKVCSQIYSWYLSTCKRLMYIYNAIDI